MSHHFSPLARFTDHRTMSPPPWSKRLRCARTEIITTITIYELIVSNKCGTPAITLITRHSVPPLVVTRYYNFITFHSSIIIFLQCARNVATSITCARRRSVNTDPWRQLQNPPPPDNGRRSSDKHRSPRRQTAPETSVSIIFRDRFSWFRPRSVVASGCGYLCQGMRWCALA